MADPKPLCRYRYMDSPLGRLLLAGASDVLHYIGFPEGKGALTPAEGWLPDDGGDEAILTETTVQLSEYFEGHRRSFDLNLMPIGTAFQKRVWTALRASGVGETRSYGEIARAIGQPTAVRAVGAANGRNPLPIVVPCHRVVGSDGKLTGFGGGLPAKVHLLGLEGVDCDMAGRVSPSVQHQLIQAI